MAMTSDDYLAQLQALLPPGVALPHHPDATFVKLLHAVADGIARIDVRSEDLIDEGDPRTAFEMLTDWERVAGLPDLCMSGVEQTTEQRRNALVAKLTKKGGASRQFFIDVAAALGIAVTISEDPPNYTWTVHAPQTISTERRYGGAFNERYLEFGNALLECVINKLKPAHTTALFAYDS